MARIKRTRTEDGKGIFISDAPEGMTKEQKTDFANNVEESIGSFSGSFEDAKRAMQMSRSSQAMESVQGQTISGEQVQSPEVPSQVFNAQQVLNAKMDPMQASGMTRDQQQQMLMSQSTEAPESASLGDMAGIALREGGPTAVAAGVGALLGAPAGPPGMAAGAGLGTTAVAITDMLTPSITSFLNKNFGTNELSSKEAVKALFDEFEVPDADTKVEEFFKSGVRGVKEAAQFIGAGWLAKFGAPVIGEMSKLQGAGEIISAAKIKQLLGGFGSEVGAKGGGELAESLSNRFDILTGPKTSAILNGILTFGGAALGDMSMNNTVDIVEKVSDLMKVKNMPMPEAIQEVLTAAKTQGVDVLLSDYDPDGNRAALDQQAVRERATGGTRVLRSPQDKQRKELIQSVANEYGVRPGTELADKLAEVDADFWAKHDGELTDAVTKRDEVYAAMEEIGGEVPTSHTESLIDAEMSRLIDGGNSKMQPLIDELANWKEMINSKSLATLEDHREYIGKIFKDPVFTALKNDSTDKAKKEIYRSLRKEMGEFIQDNGSGGDFKKYEDSMAELSRLSTYRNRAEIPAIMNAEGSSVSAIKNALFNESPEEVLKIYQKLSPDGQAAARSALITKMMDESTKHTTLSPNQFALELKNYGGQRGVLFDQADNDHLESIKMVLDRTVKGQSDHMEQLMLPGEGMPGFSRAVAGVVLKNPVLGIGGLLASAAGRGWLLRHMEKPAMRDLMLKYRALPPKVRASSDGDEILKRMSEIVRGYANAEADAQPEQGRGEEGYIATPPEPTTIQRLQQ